MYVEWVTYRPPHRFGRVAGLIPGCVCVRFSDLMIVLVCPVQTMRRQRTEVVVELRKVRSVHTGSE